MTGCSYIRIYEHPARNFVSEPGHNSRESFRVILPCALFALSL